MRKWDTDALQCPVCRAGHLSLRENSLVCSKGHCFDISSKGYVNFIPNQRKTKYSKAMFVNRRAVFEAGFFQEVTDTIISAALRYSIGGILDAGCGEGYYLKQISAALGSKIPRLDAFALDIEKEAVRLAASRNDNCVWMVADIANIPLRDNCVDAVLNVLTPANTGEFRRVCKKGGIIIKAIPGSQHLKEIRALAHKRAYDGMAVAEHFSQSFRLVEKIRCGGVFPVTPEEFERFLSMTPLMFDLELENGACSDCITIDMEILIGCT